MIAPTQPKTRTVSDLGERALIARITARLATAPWVVVGPGDDAAVIEPVRGALDVITTDVQVEGVHFDHQFVPPDAIGHRALAVNLSDLAAMGATPRAVLLSLVLPDALDVAIVDGMLDGFLALAAEHHVTIVGGNISRSPGPMMVDVTAVGAVRPRRLLTRAGARPGDAVYVTGTIGDAAVGWQVLQQGRLWCAVCQERYLRPQPRVRAGTLLGRNRAASACMDTSDGLADAVRQLAEASQVGIALDARLLPMGDEVRRWHGAHGSSAIDSVVDTVLGGGEDYELLFTVRPAHQGRLRDVRRSLGGLPITRIGVTTKDRALSIRTEAGERELPFGFDHFR
ncbi:MAG: thiamine-phosphate kinase [Acidobacteria bacterium]|nr:thiamine-phosphate kinase [Acidobacteriota bacterium]